MNGYNRALNSYYLYLNEDVEELINKLDMEALQAGGSYMFQKSNNDVLIAHMIYFLGQNGMYSKEKIRGQIKHRMQKRWENEITDSKKFEEKFDLLYDFLWEESFSTSMNKKGSKLCKMVYSTMPFHKKLLCSDAALIVFAVLFFCLEYCITELYFSYLEAPLFLINIIYLTVAAFVSSAIKKIYMIPFVCGALITIGASFIYINRDILGGAENWFVERVADMYLIIGLSHLLWLLILPFNIGRIKDCYKP